MAGLPQSQRAELDSLETGRAMGNHPELIAKVEKEAMEIAEALKSVRGIVCRIMIEDVQCPAAENAARCYRGEGLQAASNARTLTDESITIAMLYREDFWAG